MGSALKVSRVQKRGQVTIPIEIRQRLGLKEGDLVAFIETEAGVVISPQEMFPAETLNQMASYLQARGLALDELFEFADRLADEEREEAASNASESTAARRTAGIYKQPGQKPVDVKAQRREFMDGTARQVRAETNESSE